MQRRLRLLLPFCLILALPAAYAQQSRIFGTVKDSTGRKLPGTSIQVTGTTAGTATDENGAYSLPVPAGQNLVIVFSFTGLRPDTLMVRLKPGEKKELNSTLLGHVALLPEFVFEERPLKEINVTKVDPKLVDVLPTPNRNVEDLLKTLPGVNSSNELSSTYSVRGGNYDENLVYVNDIEVYRPYLIRSGQQEGLSFINSDMVDNIRFSAGGFDAKYGDKMSSVLDVSYRKPKKFAGTFSGSLLGASLELEGISPNKRFTYIAGLRQKSNQYLLNTFETKGEYKPSFTDIQFLGTWALSRKLDVELFTNYSRNRYNLVPQNRETNFGTVTDAKRFTVYFEGQEADRYETVTGALSLNYRFTDKVRLKYIGSVYRSQEQEEFDILGQYFLDQLESDFGKEGFGNVAFNLGVGSFLSHARNTFDATVASHELKGDVVGERSLLQWGLRIQHEDISDRIGEWNYLDSAGFSIPSTRADSNPQIVLNDVVHNSIRLASNRYSGYVQHTWDLKDSLNLIVTTGIRFQYWDENRQTVVSPRVSLTYQPRWKRIMSFRFAAGYYYQPPFYRELRDLQGNIHEDVQAQRSIHFVLGHDMQFLALGREFKLTTEAYYKILDDLNPYKINNLSIRYMAQNNAHGYARGIDMRLFGEFVPGTESWASLGILETKEDLSNDFYYLYLNSDGDTIIPGYTYNDIPVDSIRNTPGYIPRPADQRVSFSLFFQDYLPNSPTFKMNLSLHFSTGLPFGPPGNDRYKDILRMPTYRRVDIGFSKILIGDEVRNKPKGKLLRGITSAWLSLEIFNLLQVSNVSSYIWITDVSTARKYAVPNYLTGRQVNLRLTAKF
jgi:hypothetical protein